ncbi:formimidoylglutamate deiminase [Leeia sp. TBRC 13508]|uniref:Formimidoylglutamate deiminase n=1 Tax=Leeia speluncae TaxID=2884804 RepID=A0ABS8D5Y6_9NEIS|nr:formimidoylglutamate deiminase [Leeia speluncae]MCB6183625.1 formimidoylglutamate deiminase [Leeia speluncae]
MKHALFAETALLPSGWASNVLLEWDSQGVLTNTTIHSTKPANVAVAEGAVIPGMPNLHSHAFQRAMAGLTEYLGDPQDSFWSWRKLMYQFAQKIDPDTFEAIAKQLYTEMLKAGYTSVCEFHYVHHDVGGKPYANPAELSARLVKAATEVGIGLTLLPVLYQHSGFGEKAPLTEQARFINDPDWILNLLTALQQQHPIHAGLNYGVAPHSLRAVGPKALAYMQANLHQQLPTAPIHIHIAEQTKEVDDCVALTGQRPVEWLLDHLPVDERWCLVHATHLTPAETTALAQSNAVAGICATTEANLGDGIYDGVNYLQMNGRWGIGSDSHISVSMVDELRLFEYSQRLRDRRRNALATSAHPNLAEHLFQSALGGGAQATGRKVNGLQVGHRADLLVLDASHVNLAHKPASQLLAGLIFCQHNTTPIKDVMVGGRFVIKDQQHASETATSDTYKAALKTLLEA